MANGDWESKTREILQFCQSQSHYHAENRYGTRCLYHETAARFANYQNNRNTNNLATRSCRCRMPSKIKLKNSLRKRIETGRWSDTDAKLVHWTLVNRREYFSPHEPLSCSSTLWTLSDLSSRGQFCPGNIVCRTLSDKTNTNWRSRPNWIWGINSRDSGKIRKLSKQPKGSEPKITLRPDLVDAECHTNQTQNLLRNVSNIITKLRREHFFPHEPLSCSSALCMNVDRFVVVTTQNLQEGNSVRETLFVGHCQTKQIRKDGGPIWESIPNWTKKVRFAPSEKYGWIAMPPDVSCGRRCMFLESGFDFRRKANSEVKPTINSRECDPDWKIGLVPTCCRWKRSFELCTRCQKTVPLCAHGLFSDIQEFLSREVSKVLVSVNDISLVANFGGRTGFGHAKLAYQVKPRIEILHTVVAHSIRRSLN